MGLVPDLTDLDPTFEQAAPRDLEIGDSRRLPMSPSMANGPAPPTTRAARQAK